MNKKQKRTRNRILLAIALFVVVYVVAELLPLSTWLGSETAALWAEFALFLVPYLIAGYDVLLRAAKNIGHGQVFDENFLMSVATIGAFALVLFPDSDPHMAEGAAVMLFYQVGELFQSYAVGKSRKSIADMMDIAPDFANVERDGQLVQVDPYEVAVGDEIVVKAGERVPLDGVVLSGTSQLDTAALTGESVPREVREGDEIISGCVNMTGLITVRVTKPFGESTVSRILELVENAAEKKAKTENFITRFARYYTPAVVGIAVLLAVVPPLLLGGGWSDWVQRAHLPRGVVPVRARHQRAAVVLRRHRRRLAPGHPREGQQLPGNARRHRDRRVRQDRHAHRRLVQRGGHPPAGGNRPRPPAVHCRARRSVFQPPALSVKQAYSGPIDQQRIDDVQEQSGHGVRAKIDEHVVLVGNDKLMSECGVGCHECELTGTILHVSLDGEYIGHIVIADVVKPDAAEAVAALRAAGVKKTVMLTGDRADVAAAVAKELGIDEFRAQLLPQDKVAEVEKLLEETHAHGSGKGKLAFVGDGINDAPVLTRADIGIAMGAMGSDAAIEAADVVLMDDKPSNIARAIGIARKTMGIVWQNIVFALGIKFLVLVLAAVGIANMWLAVFADVGVAVIAILNAMRAMNVKK